MSGINMPARKDKAGLLETLVAGVRMARDIQGMDVDEAQVKRLEAEAEAAKAESARKADNEAALKEEKGRLARGEMTPGEYQALMLQGKHEELPAGAQGGLRIPMQGGAEKIVGLRKPEQKPDLRTVGKDLVQVNPDGTTRVVHSGKAAGGGGGTSAGVGTWSAAGNMADTDGTPLLLNNKTGEIRRADGTPPQSIGKNKPATADQFKVAGFARRIEQSEDVFTDLTKMGYDRTNKAGAAFNAVVPRAFESDAYKTQEQAERNFINAVLRRESGAAISPSEFDSAEQQYFPRPGDPPELVEQKAANRQQVLETLKAEAGTALDKVPRVESVATRKKPGGDGEAVAAPAQQKREPSADDKAAMEWLGKNPTDPAADAVRQTLQAKGLL